MKKIVTLFAALFSFAAVFAAPTITGISAIPHSVRDGKVDVEVSLIGALDEVAKVILTFTATDTSGNKNLPVSHIEQQGEDVGSGTSWTRKFVWDAKADVGEILIDNVLLSVKGEWQLGDVQLWENGPYFAECNVGATKPEEYGYYFWWGDTVGYKRNAANNGWESVKDGSSFSFSSGNCPTYSKSNFQLQSLGFIDSTGNLTAAHDAATAHLGVPWRMPTDAEFTALWYNCDTEWTTRNGVYGRLVKGRGAYASKSIFLPAAGYGTSVLGNSGLGGYYWSSTPNIYYAINSMYLYFYSGGINPQSDGLFRYNGQSVRPVRGDGDKATMSSVSTSFVYDGREVKDPVITPESGTTFETTLTISMSCESEGAAVYYTTDGSEPTMESTQYTKRFRISGKTTVKARAFYENGNGSEIVTAEYALGQCPEPVISTTGGETFYHKGNQVSIAYDCEEGVLHYTTDGSEPTKESPVYTAPFTNDESMVVKAKAFSDNYFDSEVVTATLTREWEPVATPVISAADSFSGSKTKVSIECATEGALIRYTTDGSEPNSHSKRYSGPFEVRETTTVKAYAIFSDYTNSEVAAKTITKNWGIGDSVGLPDHKFTTEGAAGWVDDSGVMKSGAITHNETSILKSAFVGKGMLAFEVKLACEEDDPPEYIEFDHYELWIDGAMAYKMDGIHDWTAYSYDLLEGSHEIEWRYVKDEQDDPSTPDPDGVWLRNIVWSPEKTQTSEVKVELAWIKEYFPTLGTYYFDYEEKANETAANGHKVWECYVAGENPTDVTSLFTAIIEQVDGKIRVSWEPNLNDGQECRCYRIWGSKTLNKDSWHYPAQDGDRFFKVEVGMPNGEESDVPSVFTPAADIGGVQLWEGGPYFAECNVGATKPEEYGYYFWWGDTVGYAREDGTGIWTDGWYYDGVVWVSSSGERLLSSPFSSSSCQTYGKSNSQLQAEGSVDSIGNLTVTHDAATMQLGEPWRIPTASEFEALLNNCDTELVTQNGIYGMLVKGRGDYASKSIFFPANGSSSGDRIASPGSGHYWSATPFVDAYFSASAWGLFFGSSDRGIGWSERYEGRFIRPVRDCNQ